MNCDYKEFRVYSQETDPWDLSDEAGPKAGTPMVL